MPELKHLVVVGLGNLGSLIAEGAVTNGVNVTEVRRGDVIADAVAPLPPSTPIVLAVGEAQLHAIVDAVPADRIGDVVLIQNELFPSIWTELGLEQPTICTVWALVKPGQDRIIGKHTTCHGPHAVRLANALEAAAVPSQHLADECARNSDIAAKYAFIVAANLFGLLGASTVEQGVETLDCADDVLAWTLELGAALVGEPVDEQEAALALDAGLAGFAAMPCLGRSSQARVDRALARAQALGLESGHIDGLLQP